MAELTCEECGQALSSQRELGVHLEEAHDLQKPRKKPDRSSTAIRLLFIVVVAAIIGSLMIGKMNEDMDRAGEDGKFQACMFYETDIVGRSYSEATAKCEYEREFGK